MAGALYVLGPHIYTVVEMFTIISHPFRANNALGMQVTNEVITLGGNKQSIN